LRGEKSPLKFGVQRISREEKMRFSRRDGATIHAALLLAIDTTKNELAGANGDNPGQQQRRASAERLSRRFEELLERLRRPPEIRNDITVTQRRIRSA
jgi:hypothetical protein